jgi:hypothetical protein
VGESLLHRVACTVDIAEHPECEREIAPVALSIRTLDGGDEVDVRSTHNSY